MTGKKTVAKRRHRTGSELLLGQKERGHKEGKNCATPKSGKLRMKEPIKAYVRKTQED